MNTVIVETTNHATSSNNNTATTTIHDNDNDNDDDNDSVEYLGTIATTTTSFVMSSSSPMAVTASSPPPTTTTTTTTITSTITTNTAALVNPTIQRQLVPSTTTQQLQPPPESSPTTISPIHNTTPPSTAMTTSTNGNHYNIYRHSIYVQNLAEICHTILHDRRWNIIPLRNKPFFSSSLSSQKLSSKISRKRRRSAGMATNHDDDDDDNDTDNDTDVCDSNHTKHHLSHPHPHQIPSSLFQWEYGDDCKAILLFQRLYIHGNSIPTIPSSTTTVSTTTNSCYDPQRPVLSDTSPSSSLDSSYKHHQNHCHSNNHYTDDRKYYLYSRLYYRKGPWFRIDDIYHKYYCPRAAGKGRPYHPSSSSSSSTSNTNTTTTMPDHNDTPTSNNTPTMTMSQEFEWLQPFRDMIQDIYDLHSAGYIRFFHTEMECGQTIGGSSGCNNSSHPAQHSSSLLTVEEQQWILSKIGGGPQKNNHHPRNSQPNKTKGTTAHHPPRRNIIWQQMRQQTSIRTSFAVSSSTSTKVNTTSTTTTHQHHPHVLPVRIHVETLLLQKLVQMIDPLVEPKSKQQQQQPPSKKFILDMMQQYIQDLFCTDRIVHGNDKIDTTTATTTKHHQHYRERIYIGCIRLCELPLLTLRRCVRLYLCATSGPGVMRSTPNNGYQSCRPRGCICNEPLLSDPKRYMTTGTTTTPTARIAIEPPQTWHLVQYPSMAYCFGFTSAPYFKAYRPLPIIYEDNNDTTATSDSGINHHVTAKSYTQCPPEQVFPSYIDFIRWEHYVEIRCYVDFLLESNDQYRSQERKRQNKNVTPHPKLTADSSSVHDQASDANTGNATTVSVDRMSLLTAQGRKCFLEHFVTPCRQSMLCEYIEQAVADSRLTRLVGAYEPILGVVGIIVIHILRYHYHQYHNNNHNCESTAMISLQERPWLRHMSWLAGLALIVFDIIPMLERRGLYFQAIQSLQVLLYGSFRIGTESFSNRAELVQQLLQQQSSGFYPPWISRRARGKSIVRLIIDCGQIPLDQGHDSTSQQKAKAKVKKAATDAVRNSMNLFCHEFISHGSISGCVGFSTIRTLARRLKQPLDQTLGLVRCIESNELGIRLCSLGEEALNIKRDKATYSDWTPCTDYFVANSIDRDKIEPGSRCTFVGFEDDNNHSLLSSSLNVEELAMDLYRTGRLPSCVGDKRDDTIKGGWTGWHNEGDMIRALFRIICGGPLLGMDYGNTALSNLDADLKNHATVHLSPYQQGPFHLLVGYELQKVNAQNGDSYCSPTPSFYCQSADKISVFLNNLSVMNEQALCDLVYDSVASRLEYTCSNKLKDPFLMLDILQLRTLSALAAGFGGKCLAAMFRCFLFDYRHYSGGLPDLHLFRALYRDESKMKSNRSLVELGDWIGESFALENQQSYHYQKAISAMVDDEFLGFDKPNSRQMQNKVSGPSGDTLQMNNFSIAMLPERLLLTHNNFTVKVECMMVEVKSSNDRLDPRQEDWLNVIDGHGHARVCKFVDSAKAHHSDRCAKATP